MSTEYKIREAWFRIEPMTHEDMQGFDHFRAGYILGMAEAFELAYNAADNAYATEDVLLAIREMAKEKQNG